MFRDTFGHTSWWTAEQQAAIRTAISGWATDAQHPFLPLFGFTSPASTRSTPIRQRESQRHTLDFFVRQLHNRPKDSSEGLILYGCDVSAHPLAAEFRSGPAGLDLHKYDILHHSGTINLTLIAGMSKTWTRPHVDKGMDSTWQMLVEGEKLWLLARPEKKEAMKVHFNDQRTVHWSQLELSDKDFLVDNRCLMVLQKAGDLLYIPAGWPHMVKHLTDTMAINSNVLHGWDFASAISRLEFARFDEGEMASYEAAYSLAVAPTTPLGLRWDAVETRGVWERKVQQRDADIAERESKEKEEAEAVPQRKKRRGR